MKKIIYLVIIILIVGVGVYYFFVRNNGEEPLLETVARGTVVREVSESGTVSISEEINLSFKTTGDIAQIPVVVGDQVTAGQTVARLATTELVIALREAEAKLQVAQANYDKLIAGASPEEIKVSEAKVQAAQVTLNNAQQNLADVEAEAAEDLDNAYEDALNTLDDTELKLYNAYQKTRDVQRTYFSASDQTSLTVVENKNKVEDAWEAVAVQKDAAHEDPTQDVIDTALSVAEAELAITKAALETIRLKTETVTYRDEVSAADKTSLDTHRANIVTAYTNVVNDQQTIATTKLDNTSSINTAKAEKASAEASLQKAENELALVKADPQAADIALAEAEIRQAESAVALANNAIREATLKSPVAGQVTDVYKEVGETTQVTDAVVTVLPRGELQIEVDIYEEDIVEVVVGDPVAITLVAFPNESLAGSVVAIDPAEKIINEVVYYEVTIGFDETREKIKSGMTADIVVETERKENVLVIPKRALKRDGTRTLVRIARADTGVLEEREVVIGLEGDNDLIEVLSGLTEGEQVVVGVTP